ncbi:MBL fold metallo-hydrolase [Patulibacter minatonensis]|uniref:MBL fold metallo-hydrolase n=1 Tax=Patulibacter minatonensis TaxID=298163 RepID=UPI00047DED1B|nr:MBL fold metallo-hydrolase [Patulibacter minatonensis]
MATPTPTPHPHGITELRLPTPFAVGAVNLWLIEDDPLTLVDTGANTATSFLAVGRMLEALGHRTADLGRIVLTHHHPDHAGLAGPLAEVSGAEVVAFEGLVPFLGDAAASQQAADRWCRRFMTSAGVPRAEIDGWWSARVDFAGYLSDADVRGVADGDSIAFADRTLTVHHRPGHSRSDVVLLDAERGVLVAGDHLLDGRPPVPTVTPPLQGDPPAGRHAPDGSLPRISGALEMRRSLLLDRELDADVAITGHGPPVTDVAANVARRLAEQEDEAARILGLLRESGPATAHDLVRRQHPGRRVHPYFVLCDTVASLDLLADDGAVAIAVDDGVLRYAAR